jgi:hypothetical protein
MTEKEEDRFDMWLREAGASYNAPPLHAQIPREEMWRAISAARSVGRTSRTSRWFRSPWTLAAAAAILVTVGIGIGRLSETSSQVADIRPVATESDAAGTYDVATRRHLTSAEAFVTAVRMSSYASSDTTVRRWARDLLTDTRLLLDSPASEDARRRALLQDLELLLVQIMQLENSRTSDTNELLFDKAHQDQLLTRLRANVLAGPPARS